MVRDDHPWFLAREVAHSVHEGLALDGGFDGASGTPRPISDRVVSKAGLNPISVHDPTELYFCARLSPLLVYV